MKEVIASAVEKAQAIFVNGEFLTSEWEFKNLKDKTRLSVTGICDGSVQEYVFDEKALKCAKLNEATMQFRLVCNNGEMVTLSFVTIQNILKNDKNLRDEAQRIQYGGIALPKFLKR